MNDTLSHKTVFVNGIPPSCSNDQLKETFSVIGPIKEAFVVRPKSGNVNRKLFGFVTYQSNDDAKSAVNSTSNTLSIDGTNVKVIFAKKKKFSKNIKKKPKNTNNENIGFDIVPLENENSSKLEKPVESSDFNNKFVVAIEGPRNLEDMNTVWKKKSLGDISANNLRQENKTFFVSFPNKQKALKVASRLNNIAFNDFPVTAALQMDPESKDFRKSSKKSRLIVRNLSFFCSEEELKNVFKKFGKITDTKIPVKPDGRKLGYAFIQFSHVLEAGKAIKAVNMSEIKGRKVAVDWALPREKYKEMTKTDKKEETNNSVESDDEKENGDLDDNDSDDNDSNVDEESEIENDESLDDADSADEDNEESAEEIDDSSKTNSESAKEEAVPKKEQEEKRKPKPQRKESSDVHEGKTVFIRNLSYDTDESGLHEAMEEYGEVAYCKIVMNKSTGLSKGSAFVQFSKTEGAENCVKSPPISLDGRELLVTMATTRAEASKRVKVEKEQVKEKEDKRNLYLANEGLIRPGTKAAEGLSEVELNKRQRIENAKRQKIQNPNVFVSPTRLCVHNLPRAVDDQKLKEIIQKVFEGEGRFRLRECRVMRDRERTNEAGVGRSLGFAFVAFYKHEQALKALRALNNNPDILGPVKRLIVEFSLENKLALEVQKQRKKRQLSRNTIKEAVENKVPQKKRKKDLNRKEDEIVKSVPDLSKFERKSYQGSTGTTLSGKKLKMPKHAGPKIRKRNKSKVLEQMKESKKLNRVPMRNKESTNKMNPLERKRKREDLKIQEKPKSRRSGKSKDVREDKEFNNLVAKYAKQFNSKLKGKWYEG